MANKRIVYSEPTSFFPKKLRKKYKIGEYAETKKPSKATSKESIKRK